MLGNETDPHITDRSLSAIQGHSLLLMLCKANNAVLKYAHLFGDMKLCLKYFFIRQSVADVSAL